MSMYPKTFRKVGQKDRVVHNETEEKKAFLEGFREEHLPPVKSPAEKPAPEKGPLEQPHTDPIDPRTGSRSQHPEAPAPEKKHEEEEL